MVRDWEDKDLPADHRDKLPGFRSEACDRHADPVSMDRKARGRPELPPVVVHFARCRHHRNLLANFVVDVTCPDTRLLSLLRLDRVEVESALTCLLPDRKRAGWIP